MLSVAGPDGIIHCSTSSMFLGADVSDRAYFSKALETHDFVVSDFLIGRADQQGHHPRGLSGVGDRQRRRGGDDRRASISTGCRASWPISPAGPASPRRWSTATASCWRPRRTRCSMIGQPLDRQALHGAVDGDYSELANCRRFAIDAGGSNRVGVFAPIPRHQRAAGGGVDENQVAAGDQPRDPHRLSAARAGLPDRAARRADRRGAADRAADHRADRDRQEIRPGRLVGTRRRARGCRPNSCRWRGPSTPWRRSWPARARAGGDQQPPHRDGLDGRAVAGSPTAAASRAGWISNGCKAEQTGQPTSRC